MDVLRALLGIYDCIMPLEVQLPANPDASLLGFENNITTLFDRVHHA
jgi:hypothetical protein